MFGQAGMHPLFSPLTESNISWGLNKDINFSGNGHGMAVGFAGCWALGLVKTQSSHHLSSHYLIFCFLSPLCLA